jgi:predicted  nucleic acid-binding Zn-ribbon protein
VTKKLTRNEKRLAKKAKKKVQIKRKPRAQRLPGMEDAAIKELETLAEDLHDIALQKKDLTKQSNDLNEQLVAAMKEQGRTTYSHKGIHINLSASEKAKVTIKDQDEDDTPADPESAPGPRVNSESLAVDAEA